MGPPFAHQCGFGSWWLGRESTRLPMPSFARASFEGFLGLWDSADDCPFPDQILWAGSEPVLHTRTPCCVGPSPRGGGREAGPILVGDQILAGPLLPLCHRPGGRPRELREAPTPVHGCRCSHGTVRRSGCSVMPHCEWAPSAQSAPRCRTLSFH